MVWILGGSHTMAYGSTKTWLSGDDCSSSECAQMVIQRGRVSSVWWWLVASDP